MVWRRECISNLIVNEKTIIDGLTYMVSAIYIFNARTISYELPEK